MRDIDAQTADHNASTLLNDVDGLEFADFERGVQDTVYGYVNFSTLVWAIVDTPQFQRLRSIKQLGTSYYVWPGAAHNRFEHCLGVGHLAQKMAEHLQHSQPELGITNRDVRCVTIAGLCHDLGHGPWSHVWDNHFIPVALPGKNWTHEDASEMMFDDLIDKNGIDIDQDDVDFIKDLIKGVTNHSKHKQPPEKRFLFEIVANKRNGIDVDKFDYILRDARAVGQSGNIRAERLINSARVIKDEICFHIKDANQLYELCHTRFSNHKMVYNHKSAKAIQYMIVDALLKAEPVLQLGLQIMNPAKYVNLTDDVMGIIERSEDESLAESRAIFSRIRTRDIYKCVDWKSFDWDYQSLLKQHFTPEKIVRAAKDATNYPNGRPEALDTLTKDHVIVDLAQMHYGMKEKNPLNFIKFYGKHNKNESAAAGHGDFSTLMPEKFGEVLLRVYTKDVKYYGVIQAGYRAVLASLPEHPAFHPTTSSPPITEGPSTPRAALCAQDSITSTISELSLPGPAFKRDPSSTSNALIPQSSLPMAVALAKGSPFQNNKFSEVDKNYVPKSPIVIGATRGLRRTKSGATSTTVSCSGTPLVSATTAGNKILTIPESPTPIQNGHSLRPLRRKRGDSAEADADSVKRPKA